MKNTCTTIREKVLLPFLGFFLIMYSFNTKIKPGRSYYYYTQTANT